MDSTIQVLEGLGSDEEIAVNGLASTVTLSAVGAGGGVMEFITQNKWKILGGLAGLVVVTMGWRAMKRRRAAQAAAAVGMLGGHRRRRKSRKGRRA